MLLYIYIYIYIYIAMNDINITPRLNSIESAIANRFPM